VDFRPHFMIEKQKNRGRGEGLFPNVGEEKKRDLTWPPDRSSRGEKKEKLGEKGKGGSDTLLEPKRGGGRKGFESG